MENTETHDIDIARLYAADIEALIDWDELREYDTEDIKNMIPLIMERLIKLI